MTLLDSLTDSARDLTSAATHTHIVNWLDAGLPPVFARNLNADDFTAWFSLSDDFGNLVTRIAVDDGKVSIHDFDDRGWLLATTSFTGDFTVVAPRIANFIFHLDTLNG